MTPGKVLVLMGGVRALVGVPVILGKSAIPFIGLSSGSVAANGAITGITALPVAYAAAYCWFPANILATVKAAGWYYCTFSTTTAGTAFLDTYTNGVPVIPSSPTAVTDGKGAFTGDTGEEFGPTITVPANAMGANGGLRVYVSSAYTNNADSKILRMRYSGSGGTIVYATGNNASVPNSLGTMAMVNRGATNSQVSQGMGGATVEANVYSAIDTTAATTLVMGYQRGTATDNAIIESFLIELLSDGT